MSEQVAQDEKKQPEKSDTFALKDVHILEYTYSTFKQYGYQSMIGCFDQIINHPDNDKSDSKLSFEILCKNDKEEDGNEAYSVSVKDAKIKTKIAELQQYLKNPVDEELGEKEDWQMSIKIPYEITDDQLEENLDTDAVF